MTLEQTNITDNERAMQYLHVELCLKKQIKRQERSYPDQGSFRRAISSPRLICESYFGSPAEKEGFLISCPLPGDGTRPILIIRDNSQP